MLPPCWLVLCAPIAFKGHWISLENVMLILCMLWVYIEAAQGKLWGFLPIVCKSLSWLVFYSRILFSRHLLLSKVSIGTIYRHRAAISKYLPVHLYHSSSFCIQMHDSAWFTFLASLTLIIRGPLHSMCVQKERGRLWLYRTLFWVFVRFSCCCENSCLRDERMKAVI